MSFGFLAMLNNPDRVIYPMQRVGPRGSGQWQRIATDTAISTVAQWLQDTKNTYGPYSIFFDAYSALGAGNMPFGDAFGAGVTGWDAYSMNGGMEPNWWVLGSSFGASAGDWNNISNSKLIVLWGFNPVQTQGGQAGWYLRMFREKGTPIIAIDHRYTWTAESLATQFIPIRPGTDVVLAMAMANVIFKQNLWDQDFVTKWVEPTGFASWKSYVLGQTAGPDGAIDRTPEWAAPICRRSCCHNHCVRPTLRQ